MSTIEFTDDAPLLSVDGVSIEYETRDGGRLRAIDDLSFEIDTDEILGLIGESGCGKSTVAKAVLGLLPRNGYVVDGEIQFRGVDLTTLDTTELNQVRWQHVSLISQGAMNSLNPVHRISDQIIEAIQNHDDVSNEDARARVAELFELVGLDPDRMDDYPHQFSGGMRQRAYIAMALVHDPSLIIADEPTTALDVIVQDQILKRLKELQDEFDLSILLITHDISVVAETCDRMGVMYAGKLMEYGNLRSIFDAPYNPYTLGLKNAFPSLTGDQQDLISIPGSPPDLSEVPAGCRFVERCPFATETCTTSHPPLENVGADHHSACYRHEDIEQLREQAQLRESWHRDGSQPTIEQH
ncbi:ABC transporter ATP-binding protein [Salinadaptatus halalkaliphilus]|uniref:ABC transporter ATP-binding protein n=1 Tax=Salinadaptatus halalkaliphilus TaxID=2419781 RepID=A0A4S3TPG4_9EURY|nr:ABC transporter ATP-binding protein [Salinadaptatus halalkaliphilus]THE65065.1 ABC transporter ATP-binding protein [Salinadaptatus halalkaliphilus]